VATASNKGLLQQYVQGALPSDRVGRVMRLPILVATGSDGQAVAEAVEAARMANYELSVRPLW
jgi:hypothetical protein